jgi:hypothetical protein
MKRSAAAAWLLLLSGAATALSADSLPRPDVAITVGDEEGQKVVRAMVTLQGKPLEGATVTIAVKRTFGLLPLGKDTTLDDGTAVAPFPADLPGDSKGLLHLVAEVAGTDQYTSAHGEVEVAGTAIPTKPQDPFPRALWAPHAPLPLLVSVFALLGGVWATYVFAISQVLAIRRGRGRGPT